MVLASDSSVDQRIADVGTRRSRRESPRTSLVFSICIFLLSVALSANAYLDCLIYGSPWNPPIRSDGYGYQAWGLLPWDNVHLTDVVQLPAKWGLGLR